jgi:hypothetical protein
MASSSAGACGLSSGRTGWREIVPYRPPAGKLRTAKVCKPAPGGRSALKPVDVLEPGETDRLWRTIS